MAKFQKASVLEIKASSVSHGKEPRNKNTIKMHRDKQGVRNEEGKQKRKRNERVTLTVGDWWKIRAQSMLNKRKAEHRVECGQNWWRETERTVSERLTHEGDTIFQQEFWELGILRSMAPAGPHCLQKNTLWFTLKIHT